MAKNKKKSRLIVPVVVVVLTIMLLSIFSLGLSAASYTVLTKNVDLRSKATITTEGSVNVLTDNKGNKYTLDSTSVIYSGGGTLQVYLNNTQPVTIDSIVCKGLFQVMGGSGTLNVKTTGEAAIDVGYFDVHDCTPQMSIVAQGAKYGIRSGTFIEIAKGSVTAVGTDYGTYAKTYYVIEKAGSLKARATSSDSASPSTATFGGSYIEVRDSSTLDSCAKNGKYGVKASTYLSILRNSKVIAQGGVDGINNGSYYSVLDGSSITANGYSGYGMYSEKGYASICRSSKVEASGIVTGIRVYQYFSVLDGSTLNASGCNGDGARAETQYVSVLRNSKMTGNGQNAGVYSKLYMSVLSGSTLKGMGDVGLHSDEYIHTNGAGSMIYGEGQITGILCKGNGGDSVFADGGASMYGEATATADSVGIRIYNKGQIAARSGATMQGNGMRAGIETVYGYVEANKANLKGVVYSVNSGVSAISGSKGVKGYSSASIKEEYLNANIKMDAGSPFQLAAANTAVGKSVANLSNYQWSVPSDYVIFAGTSATAQQAFSNATFTGVRSTSVSGEPVSLSGGAIHEVSITGITATVIVTPKTVQMPVEDTAVADAEVDEDAAVAEPEDAQAEAPAESAVVPENDLEEAA